MTRTRAAIAAAGFMALAGAVAWIAASRFRKPPARCGAGLVPSGPRCCPPGQVAKAGACRGTASSCPKHMRRIPEGNEAHCAAESRRVRIAGGTLRLAPNDWEAEGTVAARVIRVATFELDSIEVTYERWRECADAQLCPVKRGEPGQPVTSVTAMEAQRFCRFVTGRLPTGNEWLFAAAGPQAQRFPWGQTGLVCRRAAFGLVRGPCGEHGTRPDIAASRPDGASASGLFDMAGNVAEWTVEGDEKFAARGGSFSAEGARALKSWAIEHPNAARSDVGFRCAHDVE